VIEPEVVNAYSVSLPVPTTAIPFSVPLPESVLSSGKSLAAYFWPSIQMSTPASPLSTVNVSMSPVYW
jgi:hypothetical protein